MWSHVLSLRSKAAAWLTAGIGTFAALAAAEMLGAFEAMPKQQELQFTPNETVEAGQWRIRPLGVRVASDKVFEVTPKDGQKAIILETELTNLTARSSKDYYGVFHFPSTIDAQAEKPMIYLQRDMALLPDLHPGMTEKLAYVWLVPASLVPVDAVELLVTAKTYKARDNLTGSPGWYNDHTAGVIRLPITTQAAQQ
ncbi:hypothetical protein CU102_17555 [Phyllobacterium brassicacearum]|uniref:Uncharacterized protein n=1 Tax=Phyllobacterium brassicacearum TaxID=314235 RepID=A0A2P7BMM0_9HYPH|nr:hypothetical protein [Phyllobacterium brassicacearum]PSH67692.1 hypothetical protein CU102_17555 [Phyllobacterium brassicacearum]TDQ25932.1 hypothetical protein DEV91_113109 [Phyllobacterium brassicacearum]